MCLGPTLISKAGTTLCITERTNALVVHSSLLLNPHHFPEIELQHLWLLAELSRQRKYTVRNNLGPHAACPLFAITDRLSPWWTAFECGVTALNPGVRSDNGFICHHREFGPSGATGGPNTITRVSQINRRGQQIPTRHCGLER